MFKDLFHKNGPDLPNFVEVYCIVYSNVFHYNSNTSSCWSASGLTEWYTRFVVTGGLFVCFCKNILKFITSNKIHLKAQCHG